MQQNLARAWRAKTFDGLIGQELSVRLLKNSLAKHTLFPVYLLSGLRGSGKTSMGRIFAAAVNCARLPEFQKDPHAVSVPCLQCASCRAMQKGQHPDFVEVDAASYTGVDNVRQIIEAASFLPVMGTKKVYLIDEAHMLSKAAFNAFLKILEEPPATVLFLLATTEAHKILETVKSRSFQLFFEPIPFTLLAAHLKKVSDAEGIAYEEAALAVLAHQSEGSARDALTLLERVALAESTISLDGVYRALGLVHDQVMITLFERIAQGNLTAVLQFMHQEHFERYNAVRLWEKMVAFLRTLLWHQAGIVLDGKQDARAPLLEIYDQLIIVDFLELFHKQEALFVKTTAQHTFLESMISKMTQHIRAQRFSTHESAPRKAVAAPVVRVRQQEVIQESAQAHETNSQEPQVVQPRVQLVAAVQEELPRETGTSDRWQQFLQLLEQTDNPVATSIFRQGNFLHSEENIVRVRFAKKFEFYYEWIFANEGIWKASFEQVFGAGLLFVPEFDSTVVEQPALKPAEKKSPPVNSEPIRVIEPRDARPAQKTYNNHGFARSEQPARAVHTRVVTRRIDVSDAETWKIANELLKIFPGVVSVRQE